MAVTPQEDMGFSGLSFWLSDSDGDTYLPGHESPSEVRFEHLAAGDYVVHCTEQALAFEVRDLRNGEERREQVAHPALKTLAGRVIDSAGVPLHEVMVRATPFADGGGGFGRGQVLTVSNTDGSFSFDGLVGSDFKVSAVKGQLAAESLVVTSGEFVELTVRTVEVSMLE